MFTFDYIDKNFRELPFPRVFNIGLDEEMLDLCRRFNKLWLEKKPGYRLEARGVFTLVLNSLISYTLNDKQDEESTKRLNKVKEYILSNYNREIKIEELAAIVNLNSVYFGVYFRKNIGQTIGDYINQIRINRARDLLTTGEYKVNEAAYQCGFNDSLYFSKVFKKFMGISPSSLLK